MHANNRTNANQDAANSEISSSSRSTHPSRLKALLCEPLLHFVLLGAALFALYSYWNSDDGVSEQAIVVSAGKIEHLAGLFARTWQRAPTRSELEGLINDYVREEAAYREGSAIGLDRNDTIIRRRIRQKLDFVAGDLATQLEPTDEDLQAYLDKHPDKFRLPSRFSFRQVFFDPNRYDSQLPEIVSDLIVALQDDPTIDPQKQGDRTLLEFRYEDASPRDIANLFGERFAAALGQVDKKKWLGPIESAYGIHAVVIDDFQPGSLPELEDIRGAVHREWLHDHRQEAMENYYQQLVNKYEVVIDWPKPEGEAN